MVCQVCHYTPALDLAQVGPKAGAPGTEGNGRNQMAHQSNSRVMHNHHGQFTTLFPAIPAPVQAANGTITNQATRLAALENSCYQCHPGTNTKCLRGAMFNGGMLCSDCHGSMAQVGDDFSKNVSPSSAGYFLLAGTSNQSGTPRVPWANEPGCGSCHTGDAVSRETTGTGLVVNTVDSKGFTDGLRLRQAFRTGDAKATPIVPANKRFAEPVVPATFGTFANPGAGNPKLYRVSTGHGGVMCEGCHGSTHAEWPNANPNANDNVTSNQLQGHTGTSRECATCHSTTSLGNNAERAPWHAPGGQQHQLCNQWPCAAPQWQQLRGLSRPQRHQQRRSNNTGTVLSRAFAARTLRVRRWPRASRWAVPSATNQPGLPGRRQGCRLGVSGPAGQSGGAFFTQSTGESHAFEFRFDPHPVRARSGPCPRSPTRPRST